MTHEKAPVLLVFFNRPDTTIHVIKAIKEYKPKKIYLASDGPRDAKPEEKQIVEETRKLVLDQIDWDCEAKTFFREKNVGCGPGVSGAITWFFENEEKGIILEDDCKPNQDFFTFCEEMLESYKDDKKIMQINGSNPFGDSNSNLYIKTIYDRIWGWATWSDRWEKYSYTMEQWPTYLKNKKKLLNRYHWLEANIFNTYWKMMKKDIEENRETTWDSQWAFTILMNQGFCLQPNVNLIQNIGLDSGTHFNNPSNSTFETVDFGTLSSPLEFSENLSKKHDKTHAKDFIKNKTSAFVKKSIKKFT